MSAMLEGVRVIDMTSVVFGPYATSILADLGAEVIKIEAPHGDAYRYSAKPARTRGMSPGFLALNQGKKSIILDLKTDGDRRVMQELIVSADIFIHNVRGTAIRKLGFGPEDVRHLNPHLIYIHCVGFGSDGPYAGRQAYDDVIQAASGAATLAGRVDGSGKARYIPSLIADKVAGLYGAQAALAAYIHKLRTGETQFVEVPMFESFTQFMMLEHLGGLTFDPPNGAACYARQIDPDRQPFPTKDGYISMVPYAPAAWRNVFEILGDSQFLTDQGLETTKDLYINQDKLYQRTAELTPRKTSAEWTDLFNAAQIPCMPVTDVSNILDDAHLKETDFFRKEKHPTEGYYYQMRSPVRYSACPARTSSPPPNLGEHSDAIRALVKQNQEIPQ